jgi:hypothetical protein
MYSKMVIPINISMQTYSQVKFWNELIFKNFNFMLMYIVTISTHHVLFSQED